MTILNQNGRASPSFARTVPGATFGRRPIGAAVAASLAASGELEHCGQAPGDTVQDPERPPPAVLQALEEDHDPAYDDHPVQSALCGVYTGS
jgi:hypothetical protein